MASPSLVIGVRSIFLSCVDLCTRKEFFRMENESPHRMTIPG